MPSPGSSNSGRVSTDPDLRWLVAALLLTGAVLRLWQYFGNASLWIDEAAIALNIVGRSSRALLFTPLDYNQVAPPGFLLLERTATVLFGANELALRLLPLFSALASLYLFGRVAAHVLRGWAVPFSAALFAFGIDFIFYGAEVKQYSTDIAVSLLLMLVVLEVRSRGITHARCWKLGLTAVGVVWFSQAAVLMLAGLGTALVLISIVERDRAELRALSSTALLWGASAVAAVFVGIHSMTPATQDYMHRFWTGGFFPLPPRSINDALWLWESLGNIFGNLLHYPWPALYAALAILGFCLLWRRCDIALLLLGPVAVTLAASAARQYPFSGRVIAFLVPSFLLAVTEAAAWLSNLCLRRAPLLSATIWILLAAPPLLALAMDLPVYRIEETKPLLAYIQARRQPGDSVYVYYGGARAFQFYAARFGFSPGDATIGGCHRGDLRAYLHELDAFRGRPRVWVFFSHSLRRFQEQPTLEGYLNQIGVRRDSLSEQVHFLEGPASVPSFDPRADLYDLSEAARLASGSAEDFLLPRGSSMADDRFGCSAGPQVP